MLGIPPVVFFVVALAVLWAGSQVGRALQTFRQPVVEREASSLKTLEGAVLALLGLLLGFTFSMAISRYDQRMDLQVAEANAIGTTWLRTANLPEPARSQEQALLRQYVPVRLGFFAAGNSQAQLQKNLDEGAALQARMWSVAKAAADVRRDALAGLFLSTLNEMIDDSEKRTAALENRIPTSAWGMLLLIGFVSSVLVGVGIQSRAPLLRVVLPLVVAATLTMTFDLDSPRSGLIQVHQHSMERVAAQVRGVAP